MSNIATLELAATVENLNRVIDFFNEKMEESDCPMKVQVQLEVAVEEIFVNICHYAYAPDTGDATIQLQFLDEGRTVEITFIDSGVAFDPLAKPDPDVSLPAAERQIGGLGIYMVKKSMDAVSYSRKNDQNIFTLRKNLG